LSLNNYFPKVILKFAYYRASKKSGLAVAFFVPFFSDFLVFHQPQSSSIKKGLIVEQLALTALNSLMLHFLRFCKIKIHKLSSKDIPSFAIWNDL